VDIEVAFTKKIGAGLFGGEGFILQHKEESKGIGGLGGDILGSLLNGK